MTSPSDKRASGNPAKQAQIDLTVKQQREQKRQEKLAEYQKQVAKRKRGKLVWWVVGSTAAVAVIGLVIASFAFAPAPPTSYQAGNSTGREISGVETFQNRSDHVQGAVTYEQNPPAGGPHNPIWLNCGVYTQPQQNENAVHSMEHGAVWITYDPARVDQAGIDALKAVMPSSYALLSPYPDMDTPIAVSAWNHQLTLDDPNDPRITEFFTEYWRSQNAPEPNAACSGALDGPGKA
ncbi:DUF3105 domain-containing protein [Microbacterium sp. SL62]|uniref:DUF3105 domain-containing protein n=1 Tax=Microbacterium sp. SL62 TaxID=2995139 RepID=UPI0022756EC3|nr:DUF3105 domain-containing protein [Microbacterium sp. SL62]MCY1718147.1 DUF3105 domain-containing protein [Microbacterium sp. SL62]